MTKHGLGPASVDIGRAIGGGWIYRDGVRFGGLEVIVRKDEESQFRLYFNGEISGMNGNFLSSANPFSWGTVDGLSFYAQVPVTK